MRVEDFMVLGFLGFRAFVFRVEGSRQQGNIADSGSALTCWQGALPPASSVPPSRP